MGSTGIRRLRRLRPYQPFPVPPDVLVLPKPIEESVYGYSSVGLSILGSAPKTPDELLELMAQQRPGPRGGRGTRKPRKFFQAHLMWYGIGFHEHESVDELEGWHWAAMSSDPPPTIYAGLSQVDAIMRQKWLVAAAEEQARVMSSLIQRGATVYTSDLLAQLTGVWQLTGQFFKDPDTFLRTHFPLTAPPQHVLVLLAVDEEAENEVFEWAADVHELWVVKVDNIYRGSGRSQGRFPDFVIGKDEQAVNAKADAIERENIAAAWTFRR
ncbi:hypothetical protein CVT26_012361 [Gymnopilus dilepis]|uniref:Uncharacterized protein n=1 Tax=Gymnopilus dilepis TaxID=231916 RepID=A0A409WD84_9AGAR|nr:hypothetical protein CVT26_012361 [Gymnopilus dilepis]